MSEFKLHNNFSLFCLSKVILHLSQTYLSNGKYCQDDGDVASFEGKYPKDLFNKSVVAGDNQTVIGYVTKETDELIVVFSECDSKSRFDIPKSQIAISGSTVVVNNTGEPMTSF